MSEIHCAKSVHIWSYSGPYFPAFSLITLRIQTEFGKIWTRITPNTDTFYAVIAMSEFCEPYNLQNLVKDPTWYKNSSRPTCIDLILTNLPKSFQHTQTIETGLSDSHKLILNVFAGTIPRLKPNTVN